MKILISRPDKIGDLVLALHGAKQLKVLRPDWQVYMHVSQYTRELAENIRFLDGVITLSDSLEPLKFDAVVDLMAKPKTSLAYMKAKIPIRIGNSARWFRYRYTLSRWVRRSEARINEAEYNWKLISLLEPGLRNQPLKTTLQAQDFKFIPENSIEPCTILMPGASLSAKAWELQSWINLARMLSAEQERVLFLLGPDEQNIEKQLLSLFSDDKNIAVHPSYSLSQTLGILSRAKAFVGPSTGITHLASVLRLPGVALYPLTRSMHPQRWMPFQSSLKVLALDNNLSADRVFKQLQNPALLTELEQRQKVSAFIICKNEQENIERCLESIKWCDEIIIVDSGSTDQTLEICKKYTDRIIVREWPGHREQKQFALEQCSHDWVLNLDADEELSPELRSEIQQVLRDESRQNGGIKGYYLCRVVFFLERWWDRGGWFPEYRMRFFQRHATAWGGVNPHEKAVVSGKTARLAGFLHHYTFKNLTDLIETLNRFSENSARAMYAQGRRSNLCRILFHPPFRFLKFYFFKRGFLEGSLGFIVACCEGFYTFLKYSKLWELGQLEGRQIKDADSTEPSPPIDQVCVHVHEELTKKESHFLHTPQI